MSEPAAVLGDVTGTDLAYRDLPPADFRSGLLAAGLEKLLGRPATDLRTALTELVG
jgi:NAD(P)H dehydrogenase (quinone)